MDLVRDPSAVLDRARRLGPLPYREAGPSPGPAIDNTRLVEWAADGIDRWWTDAGRPDPFTVVELGAGDGSRARALLELGPECLDALRLVLVEEDPRQRAQHAARLPIERPAFLLGPVTHDEEGDSDEPAQPVEGIGPLVTSLAELPVLGEFGVVLAVGWVSRLASDLIERRDGGWYEVRLAAGPDALVEMLVPVDEDRHAEVEALIGDRVAAWPEGARAALEGAAVEWLSRTVRIAEAGVLAVVDRWAALTGPLPPGGAKPLALDQLCDVRRPLDAMPVELFSGLSVVTWALG